MDNNLVIWATVPVRIRHKFTHVRKIGGRVYHAFSNDYGDVPVCNINTITNAVEEVVNTRGFAYAARKRMKYRKNKKKDYCSMKHKTS